MRIFLLLVLLATPLVFAVPTLADTSSDNWKIGVLASNSETRVVSGGGYCLMPSSMPIRPGNDASLRNAEDDTIATAEFLDPVVVAPDPELDKPGARCRLVARFPPAVPQDGLRIEITPQPHPTERSPSLRVNIDVLVIIPEPFDWWYDDSGYKRCSPLGDIQFGHASPAITTPQSRLSIEWIADKPVFFSNVSLSASDGEEHCHLLAPLEFPIADEYVIEFGRDIPDAE